MDSRLHGNDTMQINFQMINKKYGFIAKEIIISPKFKKGFASAKPFLNFF